MNHMGSLKISELSTSPVTINRSEPVSKAIGLLQKTKAYEVFVTDEKEVLGIVTIRDLLKAKHILTGKIASLMTRIPVLTRHDSVGDAAKIMTDYRVRAVPIVEDGELVGQVAASSICNLIVQAGRMNLSAGRVMTPNPMVLQEDDLAAKARTVMIQKNIDHLPVLRGRDTVGIVTSDALVFRMTPSRTISFRSSGWSLPAIYDELSGRMKRLTTKKMKKRRLRPE